MARAKNFDPANALGDALRVFWTRGYRHTSLADLEEGLGIGRKSLYNTFGDKRALFLSALDRYAQRRPPVEAEDAGWAEIVQSFGGGGPFDPEQRSCFFVNTIVELGNEDDADVQGRIAAHLTQLREGFEQALTRAIATGDIPDQDVASTALYLCNALQGMSVMSRSGASHEQLRDIARRTLASVQAA